MDACGGKFNTGRKNGSMTKMEEAQMEWRDIFARRRAPFPGTCEDGLAGRDMEMGTHSVRGKLNYTGFHFYLDILWA